MLLVISMGKDNKRVYGQRSSEKEREYQREEAKPHRFRESGCRK
jgi:hypothetical protein